MAILLDVASLLLFPGLGFAVAGGVGTVWAVRWLGSLSGGQERTSWGQMLGQTRQLLEMALHPAAEELDRASGLLLVGVGAAAAASTCLWRYLLAPTLGGWGDFYVFLPLLATPTVVAFAWGDWRARGKGLGRERDALLLAHTGVLLLALCAPAVAGGSLWLGHLLHPANGSVPLAFNVGGGLAFLVAAVATTTQLALLDTVWDECLALINGAVQALLIQLLRAANWFVMVSALTLLFWVPPVAPVVAFAVALAEYAVVLVLLVALRRALRRPEARLLVDVGWLPLGVAALLSLALVAGGW